MMSNKFHEEWQSLTELFGPDAKETHIEYCQISTEYCKAQFGGNTIEGKEDRPSLGDKGEWQVKPKMYENVFCNSTELVYGGERYVRKHNRIP